MGLSIVDKVVKLYGGTITAYNDDACFECSLRILILLERGRQSLEE